MLGEKEYLSMLLNTWVVPCFGGNNFETYRFYEALECGCVPLIVEDEDSKEFINYITQYIPILPLKSWNQAPQLLIGFQEHKETFEQYRYSILNAYSSMKKQFIERFKLINLKS